MAKLFKSEVGKQAVLELYDEKLNSLDITYDYLQVSTSYGKTNIIKCGSPELPPILLIHGSNACAPIALEVYPKLMDHYQVFAVDIFGQPNKSEEVLLGMKDDSYAIWLNELITTLKLEEVTMAGFSLGGLAILKTLEYGGSNIKEVFLTCPAYILNGNPFKALLKVFIPMRRYIRKKEVKYIEQFLGELFTSKDEFAIRFLARVFLEFNMDFSRVPTISTKAAAKIQTPIYLFAADEDLLFPGQKMIKRAQKIFPSLKHAELISNSKHVQSVEQNEYIQAKIIALKSNSGDL